LSNPYHAPAADFSAQDLAPYAPQLLSVNGRIGRVRYIAYAVSFQFAVFFGLTMVCGMLAALLFRISPKLTMVVVLLPYLLATIVGFVYARRRLNDMNRSGWWSILFLVPIVGFGMLIWLLCAKGTPGPNDFGPAPSPNAGGVIAAAIVGPIVLVLFIAIAVAMAVPAYKKYTERARAAQSVQAPLAPSQPEGSSR